jgi:chaperonin GroES
MQTVTEIVPLAGRVVVRRDEAINKTDGGILLPDTAKEKPRRGTVVAVSEGKWQNGVFVETEISEGNVVLFSAFAGTEIEVNGETFSIMEDSEILAILK